MLAWHRYVYETFERTFFKGYRLSDPPVPSVQPEIVAPLGSVLIMANLTSPKQPFVYASKSHVINFKLGPVHGSKALRTFQSLHQAEGLPPGHWRNQPSGESH
jgi:hypothetical protein